jgi:hypothetical protein
MPEADVENGCWVSAMLSEWTDVPCERNSVYPARVLSSLVTPVIPTAPWRLLLHPRDRSVPTLGDELSEVGDLAARKRLERRADAAEEPQRLNAVADGDFARTEPLERETEDLVPRHPRDEHRALLAALRAVRQTRHAGFAPPTRLRSESAMPMATTAMALV